MHPELVKLEQRKMNLSKMRLLKAKKNKTPPWTIQQMEKAISFMKNRKCRDAQGLINELLKPGVAGKDFKIAILALLNKTKKSLMIPNIMKIVNIALIPKPGKRNLQHIENHRGIFLIHKFRSLLMRMLLNDKYDTIDDFMSDSNVGGRKGRSVRDHLFIVNGIVLDHHKSKEKPITFQILDFSLCFDSMWFEEVTNDLYEAGIRDEKLALIAKINESNELAIQTAVGLTRRENIERIICQGDPWGSIECSLMVDGFGKDSLDSDLQPYKYKGQVSIPLLGMVDDVFIISESGYKAQRLNGFINAKTAIKRLQFGAKKCQVMHIGKDIPKHKKSDFYVDQWVMKETEETETNTIEIKETFNGEEDIQEAENTKYLGQIISSSGNNIKNIENRANKGIGLVNKIQTTLKNTPGGKYHFELAVIMRNAILISSILSCSETWYNIQEVEYRKLESTDEILLKKILNCSSQIPHEVLYLELGLMPARFIILLRRILYLQHILKQRNKETLLYRFFKAQMENPTKNDWVTGVLKDLEKVDIDLELIEIEYIFEERFRNICKLKVKSLAFEYLNNKLNQRQSYNELKYEHLTMAEYLQEDMGYSVKEKQNLFQCRMNDLDVKANRTWKYENLICRSCNIQNQIETQEHVLCCNSLVNRNMKITYLPTYRDLYSDDIEQQMYTSMVLCENVRLSLVPM